MKKKRSSLYVYILAALTLVVFLPASAQPVSVDSPRRNYAPAEAQKAPQRVIYNDDNLPSGYTRLGTTSLWVRNDGERFDLLGRFNLSYYGSTYDGYGYSSALHVDDENDGISLGDLLSWYMRPMQEALSAGNDDYYQWARNAFIGSRAHGVGVSVDVVPLGEYARVVYSVTNIDAVPHTYSLGSNGDLQIGDNDSAPIALLRDRDGNPFGLEMASSAVADEAATLQFLFRGRSGVTDIDGYRFGSNYSTNGKDVAGKYAGRHRPRVARRPCRDLALHHHRARRRLGCTRLRRQRLEPGRSRLRHRGTRPRAHRLDRTPHLDAPHLQPRHHGRAGTLPAREDVPQRRRRQRGLYQRRAGRQQPRVL